MSDLDAYRDSQALVTGGLGFIGSHLAARLVDLGAHVTIVDSLIPEYGGNLHNVRDIENRVRINLSDIRDPWSIRALVRNQDYIFNLAGQVSHLDSMEDPETDLDINGKAQLSLLEACRRINPLDDDEQREVAAAINASRADVVWVGTGQPKQEKWMAEFRDRLEAPILAGVGAAFDFHAGIVPQAPSWMQRLGLEWSYRLAREPRRLWRRYARYNPRFVAGFMRQYLAHRRGG